MLKKVLILVWLFVVLKLVVYKQYHGAEHSSEMFLELEASGTNTHNVDRRPID
jgi:hypothetical protein